MSSEKLDIPFRQLLEILFKLRQAEKVNHERGVEYWRTKADEKLAIMGVDETTDFKRMQITFIN